MQITEIKQVGKTNKYKIYVDDEFFATLLDEDIVKNHLKSGLEIEEEKLRTICFEGQKLVALDCAMKLLGTYPKTEKELRRYLKEKGYTLDTIDYTCEKLKEYKFLDDSSFADMFIKANKGKKGKRLISFELKQKGVPEHIISLKLENLEEEPCLPLALKFMKGKPKDEKTKQKLYRHLASKGFGSESIFDALRQIFKEDEF